MSREQKQRKQELEPTRSTLGEAQPPVGSELEILVEALERGTTCLHEAAANSGG